MLQPTLSSNHTVQHDARQTRERSRKRSSRRRRVHFECLESRRLLTTLPAGFTETLITSNANLSRPTAMEFSPSGELWVLEQDGVVKVIDEAQGTASVAKSLTVDSRGERGLLGIAFAPSYDGTGPNADEVYLYYTVLTPTPHNRISRFVVDNAGTSSPSLAAESIIFEIDPEPQGDGSTNHNGGAIHFGNDGYLYVAVGDHNADGTDFRGAEHVSQRLDSPHGKLLRIDVDQDQFPSDPSRNYAIPDDNPFVDNNPNTFDETYALGLRNPFTFAIQPDGNRIFINDVGESQWEEINQVTTGANFGWTSEGSAVGFASGFESAAPTYATIGTYTNPVMAFDHSNSAPSPAGCAITGGTFYPQGGQFGAEYSGKYFFSDFCGGFIRVFDPAQPGSVATPDTSTAFASQLTSGAPVDLKVDSAGRLYYLSRSGSGDVFRISSNTLALTSQPSDVAIAPGQNAQFAVTVSGSTPWTYQWQRADVLTPQSFVNIVGATTDSLNLTNLQLPENGDRFRVIVTSGPDSIESDPATLTVSVPDQAPSITVQPTDVRVNSGDNATFHVVSTGSDPLSYQWQRSDQANPAQFQIIPGATSAEYTVNSAGLSDQGDRFRVVVRNGTGVVVSRSAELVLNQAPNATITATPTYAFGDTIEFSATATDLEDGLLPASAFTWTIDFAHQTHFHPHVAPASGSREGAFLADFIEPDPVQAYRIRLDVADSGGATHTSFFDVQPETVLLTVLSRPFAVPLLIDGTPASNTEPSVVGSVRAIQSPAQQTIGGTEYVFASWSDGGDAAHTITTPSTNATYIAQFEPAPLELTFADNSISESGGSTTATVTRRGDVSQNLIVELAVDDSTEATAPTSVWILAGNRSANFTIQGVDDAQLDGPQRVSVSASSIKHSVGYATLHVVDDEGAKVTLDVSETSFSEDSGSAIAIGTITRNTGTNIPLVVNLQFDDTSEVSAPSSVMIPAGESSAEFFIDAVDDLLIDGDQVVQLTASADFFESDQVSFLVSDTETWQNPFGSGDVNADGDITAIDALLIVNELGRRQFSDPDSAQFDARVVEDAPFFDTNGDGHATAIDVLLIINRLSRVAAGEGEMLAISASERTRSVSTGTPRRIDFRDVKSAANPGVLDRTIELLARDRTRSDVSTDMTICHPLPTLF